MKSAPLPLALLLAALAAGPAMAQSSAQSSSATSAGQSAMNQEPLDQLAQDSMAARQIGYLAADKNVPAPVAMLGDQVALVNSQIANSLAKMDQQASMSPDAQDLMNQLKNVNQEEFSTRFLAFVRETYPRMIDNVERLSTEGKSDDMRSMAANALPELRSQLEAATQLAQGGGQMDPQTAEGMNRGPIERKDDPSVIPDRPNTPGNRQ